MDYADLTEKIIGCAYRVHNVLGSGFLESVYEKSLVIEIEKIDLLIESQKPINVYYDDHIVGSFFADIIVAKTIIVEFKAIKKLAVAHEVQLFNYLAATKLPVGLLINFGESKVEVKRKRLNFS